MFSVLDIKQAKHRIPIPEESQPYLIIDTHIGLFAFKRLPNEIHSDPAISQRIMDSLLSDIPKAVSRLDDILVAGTDAEDYLRTLSLLLEQENENKTTCKFLQESVVYLRYKLDREGLHLNDDKLAAVRYAHGCYHIKVFSGTYNVLSTVHATSFHCTCTSSQSGKVPLEVVQN